MLRNALSRYCVPSDAQGCDSEWNAVHRNNRCECSKPTGMYYDTEARRCGYCTPGHAANNNHTTGVGDCPACQPGTYQPAAKAENCLSCQPGTYQPATGAENCLSCQPGTYQPATGAANCLSCQPGTYQPATGAANCPACPSNKFANASRTDCLDPYLTAGTPISGASGTLAPGWYRISLKAMDGSTESSNCGIGNGGIGGELYYVFHLDTKFDYRIVFNTHMGNFTYISGGFDHGLFINNAAYGGNNGGYYLYEFKVSNGTDGRSYYGSTYHVEPDGSPCSCDYTPAPNPCTSTKHRWVETDSCIRRPVTGKGPCSEYAKMMEEYYVTCYLKLHCSKPHQGTDGQASHVSNSGNVDGLSGPGVKLTRIDAY